MAKLLTNPTAATVRNSALTLRASRRIAKACSGMTVDNEPRATPSRVNIIAKDVAPGRARFGGANASSWGGRVIDLLADLATRRRHGRALRNALTTIAELADASCRNVLSSFSPSPPPARSETERNAMNGIALT